jgi:hypothetical protein
VTIRLQCDSDYSIEDVIEIKGLLHPLNKLQHLGSKCHFYIALFDRPSAMLSKTPASFSLFARNHGLAALTCVDLKMPLTKQVDFGSNAAAPLFLCTTSFDF